MTQTDTETVDDHLELLDSIIDDGNEVSASTQIMAGMVTVMDVNDYAFFNARGFKIVRPQGSTSSESDFDKNESNDSAEENRLTVTE